MVIFEKEEQSLRQGGNKTFGLASFMRKRWDIGDFWYSHAPEIPRGLLYIIFINHIPQRFKKPHDAEMVEFERTITSYWAPNIQKFLDDGKMKDKEVYETAFATLSQPFKQAHVSLFWLIPFRVRPLACCP
ncbi:uncharacterized protein BP01DRAFT_112887 [Aspergillus saccharolyticus JOP 1030-1]|uniref:Uncharacterized protein n=1 Tax=Aspergillus saccharolyticus JOP 1030-1 TaxID=1450539 RepID=A0A319AQY6_9EURO|nr:hypothetical protein BP01DRAFT_112887 [Aspergillus saccharolyticus JOP 1030-1]PYH48802.1 hypothetical protein BP01DRAFT_112887 [Aspergillus saccharolyticus JOP 1030-1]